MQVWPKNDAMRKVLRHVNGTGFRAEGPAEWPDDSFTARRVRDGDVSLTEVAAAKPEPKSRLEPKSDLNIDKAH